MGLRKEMVRAIVDGIARASIYLPLDVKQAIQKAYEEETHPVAKVQLQAILKNVELAERLKAPICQDTGLITFYVRVGLKFPEISYIEKALVEAVRIATKDIPLRPNTVDPINGHNPGDNTGRNVPIVIWDGFDPNSDSLEIVVVPKGGGSEYVTSFNMMPPGKGFDGVKELVLDTVIKAGAMPCPPTIIGVGIGGTADFAMYLAKKAATIRKIGSRHPDPVIADLERSLLEMVNQLGIGTMGMGGKTTALAIHIDYAYRHPATYCVAIAFQCWAARRATIVIKSNGEYDVMQ